MTTTLFVCVHNAGRSRMAASIFNAAAQRMAAHARVVSGHTPAERVHPNVAPVMEEWGIDLTLSRPQPLTDDAVAQGDCDGVRGGRRGVPSDILEGRRGLGAARPPGRDLTRRGRSETRLRGRRLG